MTSSSSRRAQLSASVAPLRTKKTTQKAKKAPVADSWEDEPLSDSELSAAVDEEEERGIYGNDDDDKDDGEQQANSSSSRSRNRMPDPPPPTPISPTTNNSGASRMQMWMPSVSALSSGPMSPTTATAATAGAAGVGDDAKKRPEKTDAVARRMIAGALGLRAPKMTEEQRAYDKAVKEQEKTRREREREEERRRQEEAERARAAVWED